MIVGGDRMAVKRCFKKIAFEPPRDTEDGDYFLFKGYHGEWLVWKNALSPERYSCDNFIEALNFARPNARVRGRVLWLSLDCGASWEQHPPRDFDDPELLLRCA